MFKDAKYGLASECKIVDVSRDLCLRQHAALLGLGHHMQRHTDDADSGNDWNTIRSCFLLIIKNVFSGLP